MDLQEQLVSWDNLRLAYQNAAARQARPTRCSRI